MSFHHHYHHNNHQTTTTPCCCHSSPPSPPPPPQSPYPTTDPLVLASVVSQLLQTPAPNPQSPFNFFTCTNFNNPKQTYPHPDSHHFQHPYSIFSSLLQRIDNLEASLNRFSSSSSVSSLRDCAARTIQTHFRSYLVRRSITLRQLKDLASIKSRVTYLKSSFSRNGFVDFDSLSRKATDLLLQLDSIQSGEQMIRDSKRSITREIVQFLEMVDGVCVRRRQVLTKTMKNMRVMRNDCRTSHDGRVSSEGRLGSKCESMSSNDKKLIANLRKRVERIGRMSRALQDDEVNDAEIEGFECLDNDDDIIDQITNNYRLQNLGYVKKNSPRQNGKKRVCFVEDGNVVRIYDNAGDIRSTFRDIDEIEDSSKGRQDEEEAECDGEQLSQSSKDGQNQDSHLNQDGDFTFSAPEPLKMEARADLVTRKPGVKIVG